MDNTVSNAYKNPKQIDVTRILYIVTKVLKSSKVLQQASNLDSYSDAK